MEYNHCVRKTTHAINDKPTRTESWEWMTLKPVSRASVPSGHVHWWVPSLWWLTAWISGWADPGYPTSAPIRQLIPPILCLRFFFVTLPSLIWDVSLPCACPLDKHHCQYPLLVKWCPALLGSLGQGCAPSTSSCGSPGCVANSPSPILERLQSHLPRTWASFKLGQCLLRWRLCDII